MFRTSVLYTRRIAKQDLVLHFNARRKSGRTRAPFSCLPLYICGFSLSRHDPNGPTVCLFLLEVSDCADYSGATDLHTMTTTPRVDTGVKYQDGNRRMATV